RAGRRALRSQSRPYQRRAIPRLRMGSSDRRRTHDRTAHLRYPIRSRGRHDRMTAALLWPKRPRFCRTGAMLLLLGAAGAYAGPPGEAAVPAAMTERAQPLGIANSRFWADTGGSAMVREAKAALAREWVANPHDALAPASYLGISGGSDNGAFGAGLLVGWTEAATRPEFKLVAESVRGP